MYQKNEPLNAFIDRVNNELGRLNETNERIDKVEKVQELLNDTFLPKFDNRPIVFEDEEAMKNSDLIKKGDICMVFCERDNGQSFVKVYRIDSNIGLGTKIVLKNAEFAAYPISITDKEEVTTDSVKEAGDKVFFTKMERIKLQGLESSGLTAMEAIAELSLYIAELEKKMG